MGAVARTAFSMLGVSRSITNFLNTTDQGNEVEKLAFDYVFFAIMSAFNTCILLIEAESAIATNRKSRLVPLKLAIFVP